MKTPKKGSEAVFPSGGRRYKGSLGYKTDQKVDEQYFHPIHLEIKQSKNKEQEVLQGWRQKGIVLDQNLSINEKGCGRVDGV